MFRVAQASTGRTVSTAVTQGRQRHITAVTRTQDPSTAPARQRCTGGPPQACGDASV